MDLLKTSLTVHTVPIPHVARFPLAHKITLLSDTPIGQPTASLRSCEYSKNDELCINKIHYRTMILYLNYKNNVYKVENVNGKNGR